MVPRFRTRRVVPGTLDAEALGRAIDAIRHELGAQGEVHEELGRTVWTARGDVTATHVTLVTEREHTLVEVSADRAALSVVLTVIPTALGLALSGVAGAVIEPSTIAGGVALVAGMTTGAFAAARVAWAVIARRSDQQLAAAAAAISRQIAAVTRPPSQDEDAG